MKLTMGNCLILNEICIDEQKIQYSYRVTGYWKKYFSEDEKLYVSYSEKIEMIPEHIAVIPFLMTFMPLAWLFRGKIIVRKIDKKLLDSLNKYREEMLTYYSRLKLGETKIDGEIAEDVSDRDLKGTNTAVCFSGGVDAWATLLHNISRNPYLLTVIGADIESSNFAAGNEVREDSIRAAKKLGTKAIIIESNLRKVVNENLISRYLMPKINSSYWPGILAGIGIVGLCAPISYMYGFKEIYVSTSYTDAEVQKGYRDAIISNFINALGWRGTSVIASGGEESRQKKVINIVEFRKAMDDSIKIRSCWKDLRASNCCNCEKCYRTAMAIAATGEDPRLYGFDMKIYNYLRIPFLLTKSRKKAPERYKKERIFWIDIKENFNNSKWYLKWIKYYKF